MQLAFAGVISVAVIYLYFAYSRELFPFTKSLKTKVNSIIKGEEPAAVDETPPTQDEYEDEYFAPSGVPGTLSNLDLTDLYNLMIYNQRRLEGDYDEHGIIQGGDVPEDGESDGWIYDQDQGYTEEGDLEDGGTGYDDNYEEDTGDDRPVFDPSTYQEGDEEGRRRWRGDRGRHRGWYRNGKWPIELPPDIPEEIPDEALADIGQLRDVRDRLLAQLELVRQELQDQVDELQAQLDEEQNARQDLEDTVAELKDEIEKEPEPVKKKEITEKAITVIAEAKANYTEAVAKVEYYNNSINELKTTEAKAVDVVNWVNSVVTAVATAGTGTTTAKATSGSGTTSATTSSGSRTGTRSTSTYSTTSRTSSTSRTGSTSASAGTGGAVACAGSICVRAGLARKVGMLSRRDRQIAFSQLQNKARRMNIVKPKPTAFLKNKQFLNVLPPVVKKRHFSTRLTLS